MASQHERSSEPTPDTTIRSTRSQAEEFVRSTPLPDADSLSTEEITRLLYELRVHQIELEVQNEELRRTQEALLEARTRYFDLYDLAPVGYLTVDENNTILESNLAAATMLGATRQVLGNSFFTRYILTEDQDQFYLHRKRLLVQGEMQQFEVRLRGLNGDVFWARLDASLAFDDKSNLPLCLLTMIDVDESKRQAEATKLNTIIVNRATDAIFTTGPAPDYIITSWNPGAEEIYGWNAQEAIGRSARILRSEYPGRNTDTVRRNIVVSGEYTGEVIQTTKSDDRVHIDSRVVALTDEQGNVTGWINVNRDVTEQKQAEAALRQSQHNLAQAQHIGHIGSWEWDLQRSEILWSGELYRIFGVPADFALSYASVEAMIHPDDRALNNAKVQGVLANGLSVDFQFRIIRPDGMVRHIEQHIVVERNLDGTPERLTGIMQDVTERKRAEEEREALPRPAVGHRPAGDGWAPGRRHRPRLQQHAGGHPHARRNGFAGCAGDRPQLSPFWRDQ